MLCRLLKRNVHVKHIKNSTCTFKWRRLVGRRMNQFGFQGSIFSQNPLQKLKKKIQILVYR